MGRDNPPKERQRKELERKKGQRAAYDRILIVSEGSRTEPNYFSEIRATYRLHTANVVVQPSELGTAPRQVVEYAKALFENGDSHKNIQPRAFEKVFAVFDRDDHPSFHDALQLAASFHGALKNDAKQAVTFQAIASVPSFELWLLLHFEDIQAPMHRDDVIASLKKHLAHYCKGTQTAFSSTREHLATATQRAELLAQRSELNIDIGPFSAIGELVSLLTTLRD